MSDWSRAVSRRPHAESRMLLAGIKVRRYLVTRRAIVARVLSCFASSLAAVTLIATNADALDDSRTLTIFHTHTQESATVTFWRGGSYVPDALKQLNHLLRDWRVDQSTSMDPRLFDMIWEMHRATGSRAPVHIISAYRSPQTNQALRSRSRAVSEHSQHILGRAMDIRIPDVECRAGARGSNASAAGVPISSTSMSGASGRGRA